MAGRVIMRAQEPSRVVATLEELEMLGYSGYREEQIGSEIKVIPNVSRAALANLRFGQLPAVTGHDGKLATFVNPGSREWKEFFSTRKVVETEDTFGRKRVEVTSNIADVLKPEQVVHMPVADVNIMQALDEGPGQRADSPVRSRRPRKYELVDLLTDTYIMDKFAFPESFMNSVKFMAITNPDQAAAKAQAYMRHRPGSEEVVVVAGKYARSRQWAISSVRAHATRFPQTMAAADSVVIGKKVSLFGPGDPEEKRWSVYGPAKYMLELIDLHKVVSSAGTAATMFALGTELTVLDIDIHNGDDFESPTVYLHAGVQEELPMESSPVLGSYLSAEGRSQMDSYVNAIDLVELDNAPVASAVRISSKHVLVNSHVLDTDSELTISGKSAYPVRMLSKDLWLVKSVSIGDVAWPLRDAEIGEAVVICYRRGDELQYSSPVTVRSTDGQTLVMSKSMDLQHGMSGGAIIALSDFSLLGVYDGVGSSAALGLVFSQEAFTDVCTMDRVTVVDHEEATGADGSTLSRMKSKGLSKYLKAAIESIRPVYQRTDHVGMGYVSGSKFITTCDPDTGPLSVGRGAVPKTYERLDTSQYYFQDHHMVERGPLLVRRPSFGEEVFVLGKDEDGPYFSSRQSRVLHVGVSAKTFVVGPVQQEGALPLTGGLVIAAKDAAVLGQYVSHTASESFGEGGYCISLWRAVSSRISHVESLAVTVERLFPFLHPSVWEPRLLDEVFTHSSVLKYTDSSFFNSGMLPLAFVGDAVMRQVVGMRLRDMQVPYAQWQMKVQLHLSNAALTSKAEELGLANLIRVGSGVRLALGSKTHADVLEALAAAVYLNETSDTFVQFMEAVGAMPSFEV